MSNEFGPDYMLRNWRELRYACPNCGILWEDAKEGDTIMRHWAAQCAEEATKAPSAPPSPPA